MLILDIKPFDSDSHSTWVTLIENDLSNDCPEVTTVSTMGELLESPMSMYTETIN